MLKDHKDSAEFWSMRRLEPEGTPTWSISVYLNLHHVSKQTVPELGPTRVPNRAPPDSCISC